MPAYDYQCLQCSHTVEVSHSIHETPKVICPACGGFTRRVISGTAPIILKTGSQPSAADHSEHDAEGHQCGSHCAMHLNLDTLLQGAEPSSENTPTP